MSLDSIVQYVSVELKLNSKSEAHIKDRHGHGNRDRRDDRNYHEIQEDSTIGEDRSPSPGSEDGKRSSRGEYMTREHHEETHFFVFLAHNTKRKIKWVATPLALRCVPRFMFPIFIYPQMNYVSHNLK